MDKKKLVLIGLILVSVSFIGVYYLQSSIHEDIYYENYRLESIKMDGANEQSVTATANIFAYMMGNGTSSNTSEILGVARDNASSALEFNKEMQKYAITDSEKKYSEIMLKQSYLMIKDIDLLLELDRAAKHKNLNRVDDIMTQLKDYNDQLEQYETEMENIKNNDTNFKKRIEKEYLNTQKID
ncbi:MAG: hypothetical protein WAL81_09130 [Methanobacterium sp.]